MAKRPPSDDAFETLLRGDSVGATPELARLTKLASALRPASRPGPAPQFRTRLRNELLAQASAASAEDTELFAAFLDGRIKTVPSEIRPLVSVAAALEPTRLPLPDPAFRYRLRSQLVYGAAKEESLVGRIADRLIALNDRMRRSLRAVGATGLVALMMIGTGAAFAAAPDALPGDALHKVKLFRESAQRSVVSGKREGILVLRFARTRAAEARGLADRGERSQSLFVQTFARMDVLTLEGSRIMSAVFDKEGDVDALERIQAFSRIQAEDLSGLADRVPPGARPALLDSLSLAERVGDQAAKDICGCPGADDPIVKGDPTVVPDHPENDTTGQTIGCACEAGEVSDPGDGATPDPDGNNNNGGGDPDPDPTPTPTPDEPRIDLPDELPDEPEQDGEDLIDDLIDTIESLSPTPLPTLPSSPPLPVGPGL